MLDVDECDDAVILLPLFPICPPLFLITFTYPLSLTAYTGTMTTANTIKPEKARSDCITLMYEKKALVFSVFSTKFAKNTTRVRLSIPTSRRITYVTVSVTLASCDRYGCFRACTARKKELAAAKRHCCDNPGEDKANMSSKMARLAKSITSQYHTVRFPSRSTREDTPFQGGESGVFLLFLCAILLHTRYTHLLSEGKRACQVYMHAGKPNTSRRPSTIRVTASGEDVQHSHSA
mmetsp:Transcript_3849/g.7177  ORF Transcript_3849/g.7177 Transcript_3849/m.7177 type:complete len:235 (-) Transcript_3849:965-1669(-)